MKRLNFRVLTISIFGGAVMTLLIFHFFRSEVPQGYGILNAEIYLQDVQYVGVKFPEAVWVDKLRIESTSMLYDLVFPDGSSQKLIPGTDGFITLSPPKILIQFSIAGAAYEIHAIDVWGTKAKELPHANRQAFSSHLKK